MTRTATSNGRLRAGMMAGFKSVRWPASCRNKWPASSEYAIYTRKSTEEGLDQQFNSLDPSARPAALICARKNRNFATEKPRKARKGGDRTVSGERGLS